MNLPTEVFVLEEDPIMNTHSTYDAEAVAYNEHDAKEWVSRDPDHRTYRPVPIYARVFGTVQHDTPRIVGEGKNGST